MSSAWIDVKGDVEVRKMLHAYMRPQLVRRLDAAMKEGAKVFIKPLKSEAKGLSRRMARSVWLHHMKPRSQPGWVAGHHRAKAYFWHFLIGGTKAHGPLKKRAMVFVPGWNPYIGGGRGGVGSTSKDFSGLVVIPRGRKVAGIRARPIVSRVAAANERRADAAIDRSLDSTEA